MKSLMIILIFVLSLVNFPPDLQAQPLAPLSFTIDETNPSRSVTDIYNELLNQKQFIYSGFQSDFQTFMTTLINSVNPCPLSPCPKQPSIRLNSFSAGIYNLELQGLIVDDPRTNDNVLSAYIRYDTPPAPGSPNFSILQSRFNNNLFSLTHSNSASTVVFFALLSPSGRSQIRAIIIADKYIL